MKSLTITVYTGEASKALLSGDCFEEGDQYGARYATFTDIPPAAIAVATGCRVECDTASNRFALGEFYSMSDANGTSERVHYTSTGEGVVIVAPSVAAARDAWKGYMRSVENWTPTTDMVHVPRIRVYGAAGDPLLYCLVGDGRAYADFDGVEAVPTTLATTGLTFVVSCSLPANNYRIAKSMVADSPAGRGDRAKVTATGLAVSVASSSLSFADRVFGVFIAALTDDSDTAEQAKTEFDRLFRNANG